MAARNHRLLKQTYRLFASAGAEADGPTAAAFASSTIPSAAAGDEFDESDIWGSSSSPAADDAGGDAGLEYSNKSKAAGYPGSRGAPRMPSGRSTVAASLPVNIPDWSKILRDEYLKKKSAGGDVDEEEEEGEGAVVVPPHEYLWKKRGAVASFSVHEGVGRTLKGRDLSRVRNAVWLQTGFQD